MKWSLAYSNTSKSTYVKLLQHMANESNNDLPLSCFDGVKGYEVLNDAVTKAESESIVTPIYEIIMEEAATLLDRNNVVSVKLSLTTPFPFIINGITYALPLIQYVVKL